MDDGIKREARNPIRDFLEWAFESARTLVPDGGTDADASFRREAAAVAAARRRYLGDMARLASAPSECGDSFLSDMGDSCLQAMLGHFSIVVVEADQLSGEISRELESSTSKHARSSDYEAGKVKGESIQDEEANSVRRQLLGDIVRFDLAQEACGDGLLREMEAACLRPLLKELGRVVGKVEELIADIRREVKLRAVT